MTANHLPEGWQHRSTTALARIALNHKHGYHKLVASEHRALQAEIKHRYGAV